MRVLIHAHTTFSAAGKLTPAQLASVAHARGFKAVLIADDFEALGRKSFAALVDECSRINSCLMVPGYERTFQGYDVLALGVNSWFDDSDVRRWCDRVRAAGGITAVAHPVCYDHVIAADILEAVDAVEVWNSKLSFDGKLGPNPQAYRLLGKQRFPVCSQDLQGKRASTVAMQLDRECATFAQIASCLKAGNYRMTNGFISYKRKPTYMTFELLNVFHLMRRRAVKSALRFRHTLKGWVKACV